MAISLAFGVAVGVAMLALLITRCRNNYSPTLHEQSLDLASVRKQR